jgi:hypothetical protein
MEVGVVGVVAINGSMLMGESGLSVERGSCALERRAEACLRRM